MSVDNTYIQLLGELKERIQQAQQRAASAVNTEMLGLYWYIGNVISNQIKNAGWGAKIVDLLSKDLKTEFPDMAGFSPRNLRYMRSFAEAYPDFMQGELAQLDDSILQPSVAKLQQSDKQKDKILQGGIAKFDKPFMQPAVAQIPWSHHIVILDRVKETNTRLYYIQKAADNGWSKDVLALQIENKLHERQGQAITNFERTLPKPQSDLAKETLKSPYLFDFLGIGEDIQERELEKALVQHIRKFLLELGKGFAYVGNQYHLQVGNDDFYLDLLFYNFHLHCFVVFELKVGEFKPEYTGKLNFYVNAIDEQIKSKEDKQTIGVLLCKTPNETVIKYSLKGIESPLGVADYQLPKKLKSEMPTIEELESAMGKLKK